MQDKLRALEERFESLTEEMGRPEALADYQKLQALAKERSGLEQVVSLHREMRRLQDEIEEAREFADSDDAEMSRLAREELSRLEPELERLEQDLRLALLPTDPRDERDVVEIRG